MLEYREPETEFFNEEDNSSLTGTAVFTYCLHSGGTSVAVFLRWVEMNGYALDRMMLIKMFGAEAVYRAEEVQADRLQEKLTAGDLLAEE